MGNKKGIIIYVKSVVLLFLGVFLYGCNSETFTTEKELLDYIMIEENGFTQSKTVNGYDFQLTYKPTDLLVEQEIGNLITDAKVKILREKYNKHLYFILSMSKNNQELLNERAGDRNEFGVMVNQLAFGMNEKVHLYTQSKDTIALVDFVYPRMYGMSRSTSILFIYPKEENKLKEETLSFTIEDLGLYTGEVKFKIDTNIIKNEPQLSFKN
ncbi:hypothetical protein [Aquimarina sp. 2201CG14-23]|uniref:hypothetical protein n=1 Tax=Aquimarina mycalae TaxID=3040073 RepID=UPI00247823FD|nr:hypothetical protein [Aquimarina sp. 2201CG14-23]MDH7445720.1 hypothetical protein [Aquimarina sp. 2201CG14-23]